MAEIQTYDILTLLASRAFNVPMPQVTDAQKRAVKEAKRRHRYKANDNQRWA